MNIIGIDQSFTYTGIVVLSDDTFTHAEVITTSKDESIYNRAWTIQQAVSRLVIEHNIDEVHIEGLAFGMRGNATRDLAGLQFVIVCQLQCNLQIPVNVISPKSLKKFATGSGSAKKTDMFNALPQDIQDSLLQDYKLLKTKGLYDVTDAYFLATYQ
jgi:Holliday junction resolvasome RuvABC endonuclease subunit